MTCGLSDCDRPHKAKGLCNTHYERQRRTGDIGDAAIAPYGIEGCTVENCYRPHHSLGLCLVHYWRLKTTGTTGRTIKTAFERFIAFIPEGVGDDECWEWIGARDPKGYGRFGDEAGITQVATRWGLGEVRGRPLETTEWALHTCDNPPCVNPAHLYVGTAQENTDDMVARGRGWWQ